MLPALGMVHVPRPLRLDLGLDLGAGIIHSAMQDEVVMTAMCRNRSKIARGEIEVLVGKARGLLRDGSTASSRSKERAIRSDLI